MTYFQNTNKTLSVVFNEKHPYVTLKALSCVEKLNFEILLKLISKCNQNITKHDINILLNLSESKIVVNFFFQIKI